MQIRLTVCLPGTPDRDVVVDAPSDVPASTVVRAVAERLGLDATDRLVRARCVRTDAVLAENGEIGAAGLRQGDSVVLEVGPTSHLPTSQLAAEGELTVVRGPDAGLRRSLSAGEIVLGRDPARADIVINDPVVSGVHARLRVSAEGVFVADDGSRNGTFVGAQRLRGSAVNTDRGSRLPPDWREILPSDTLRLGDTELTIRASARVLGRDGDAAGFVTFNRPPRAPARFAARVLDVPRPPDEARQTRLSLGTMIVLPLLFAAASAKIMENPLMLSLGLFGPVVAGWSYFEGRRSGQQESRAATTQFHGEVRRVRASLATLRAQEAEVRLRAAPGPIDLAERVRTQAASVWERRPTDPDFLQLRLGLGDQRSSVTVRVLDGGSAALRVEAERELQTDEILRSVPITADLGDLGSVGLSGENEAVGSMARWLVAQAAALHSPRDLVIAAAISADRLAGWTWLKWLPHTSGEVSPLKRSHLATQPTDAAALIDAIVALVRQRQEQRERGSRTAGPSVLVVMDERLGLNGAQVSKVLSASSDLGIASIWLGSAVRDVPGDCRGLIGIESGLLSWRPGGDQEPIDGIHTDGFSQEDALETARALAPLRDVSAEGAGGQVPQRLSLFELLGVHDLTAEGVMERWRSSTEPPQAPIGRTAASDLVLDLVRDGPHGLIAGTTGAGKSELLQTMIASLAVASPPNRLTFLLVDYKGGAAFRECVALPHALGIVTDLDEHLTERALTSLNAELKRRERLLAAAGAKDLATMMKRDPSAAPPRLLIVIDEFATLAREVPAFVDGVVDIAQRGRSLGVHMFLATQRPAGVVTPSIKANTNLRIALRVGDAADSDDVIDRPAAAAISRSLPGRGYARIGHDELVEFQAAYSGARLDRAEAAPVEVTDFDFGSRAQPSVRATTSVTATPTELQRIVDVVSQAATAGGMERQPPPWLPPLPEVVVLDTLTIPPSGHGGPVAVLGLADEPAQQRQRPALFDLEVDGSLIIYGAGGTGKTTLMRTIALSLSSRHRVAELQIYGIDLATGGLKALEELPHCGSVIVGNDEERVMRLVRRLGVTIAERRRALAAAGVSRFGELEADGRRPPRLLILLNGYAGFVSAFERSLGGDAVEALPRLVSDGHAVGMHFVISAERRSGVPGALVGVVSRRVILRMSDEDEYASLGLVRRQFAKVQLPPGRGFLDDGTEIHCAVVSADVSGRSQAATIAARGAEMRTRDGTTEIWRVGLLPEHVDRATLPAPTRPLSALIGIRDSDLTPAAVSLEDGHFVVLGPIRSGRTTALETMVTSLIASTPGLATHLLAPRANRLTKLAGWESVARGADWVSELRTIDARIRGRAADAGPVLVVIDDGDELLADEVSEILTSLIRRGRDGQLRVLAAIERSAARRVFGGWFNEIKKDGRALLLRPDVENDGEIFGLRLPRTSVPVDLPGRGYLVERGRVELVQVAAGNV